MPNWCEGNLRIRGTKENIKKFLENEIVVIKKGEDFGSYIEEKPEIVESEDAYVISYPGYQEKRYGDFYIRNTKQNFIHWPDEIGILWPEDEDETIVFIKNFRAAWSFKDQGWKEHAMKYNVDFRMFGYERDGEFSQIMTVSRAGGINIETKRYSDWLWDCPFSNLGG